ncbi:MAG: bifunctional glycosyltransferase family 2/GtrA family protein [Oscillospiraceae bacterium]|nr:bifunctional glycosyltransferase family 2/GtrA family protein [Oscillospiraceae bacterium]
MPPVTVAIPSLNPDEKLLSVVAGLEDAGFRDIVVVDDGSAPEYAQTFSAFDTDPCVTVLTHEVNCGKGAALKTAFFYILENRPNSSGVVTVDGDGQHTPEDVCRLSLLVESGADGAPVILGVRDFSAGNVPLRSFFGNRITCLVFRVFCGLKLSDTQTGLRAIPRRYLDAFLKTKGDRFEYETNMLLEIKARHVPYKEEKIATVYEETGHTSHFRTVRDSVRIYALILKFIANSIFSALIDNAAFALLLFTMGKVTANPDMALVTAFVAARIISSATNFIINKNAVFTVNRDIKSTVIKYYIVAAFIMAVSVGAVKLLTLFAGSSSGLLVLLFKIIIDTALFLASFRLQREWVFGDR